MTTLLLAIGFVVVALALTTWVISRRIERKYPPAGQFAVVNDTKLHFVDTGEPVTASSMPPIVFLHGASGNLHDQAMAFQRPLQDKARLIFVDRPGHGWSGRGPSSNNTPAGQAATLAALLDHLELSKAMIAGHSFGGAIATSFALYHPEKTHGVMLMSPVSHTWPGGITWYYTLTALPVIGHLFAWTLAIPGGLTKIKSGTRCVFAPNRVTTNYAESARTKLLFRPRTFRWNAIDVANLYNYVKDTQSLYPRIKAPTIIITGNKDTVVLSGVHSVGLARDIEGAKLYWIDNLGHKPDHVAVDLACAALENIGNDAGHDLEAIAKDLEASLRDDAFGPLDRCLSNDVIRDAVTGKTNPSPPPSNAGQAV